LKLVVQRTKKASVEVEGRVVSEIERGLLVFIGIRIDDKEEYASYLADKILHLRIFEDPLGKMNRSILEAGGSILVVSQFTIYGDCLRGRRPSFTAAAPPNKGRALYEKFIDTLQTRYHSVKEGVFGAKMVVFLENDGPVTFILEKSS
jgi:D-tyrosyl-tRNA(Tyr) deacylase